MNRKWKQLFGDYLSELVTAREIARHVVVRVTGVDKGNLSRFMNNHRTPYAWKAFMMGWELGIYFERRRMLSTPEGRLLCTA